jgi:hypothetical protein
MASVSRVMLLLGIVALSVCASASATVKLLQPPSNVVAEVSPDLPKYDLRRIGIIAFVNQSGTPDAGVRIANFFFDELDTSQRYEVAPPLRLDEETELEFTRTAQGTPEEDRSSRLRQFVREWIGRVWPAAGQPSAERAAQSRPVGQTAAPLDAVLTGVIIRYDDRNGNAFLVDQPASVAYEAYLISARDGEILWRARFDETQKPLLDNLLLAGRFFKGGGIWQTHDTLARIGLERVMKTFPGTEGKPLP